MFEAVPASSHDSDIDEVYISGNIVHIGGLMPLQRTYKSSKVAVPFLELTTSR